MTDDHAARGSRPGAGPADIEPTDIEALLPWHAVGTLGRRDRQRVADALHDDAALAGHADLVREELAETIYLNESLGVPSPRAMERLMAAIDDEQRAEAELRACGIAVADRPSEPDVLSELLQQRQTPAWPPTV